jgi:hypothetical protein
MDVRRVPVPHYQNRLLASFGGVRAFKVTGAEWNMGSRLLSAFLGGTAAAVSDCASMAAQIRDMIAQRVRSLLPLLERAGIANVEEVAMETLADRPRDGAIATECVTFDRRAVFLCSGGSATGLSVDQHPLELPVIAETCGEPGGTAAGQIRPS